VKENKNISEAMQYVIHIKLLPGVCLQVTQELLVMVEIKCFKFCGKLLYSGKFYCGANLRIFHRHAG